MTALLSFLKTRCHELGVLLLVFCLYLPFLDVYPAISMDESWMAFYAYDLWGNTAFPDLNSPIQYQLFMVYPFLLGKWNALMGISLAGSRALSVLFAAIAALPLFWTAKRLSGQVRLAWLATGLFLLHNIMFITYRWVKPEGLVTTFLVLMVWALVVAFQEEKPKWGILAGVFASLMVQTHPYSAVVVLACLVAMLTRFSIFKHLLKAFVCGGVLATLPIVLKALLVDMAYLKETANEHLLSRVSVSEEGRSLWARVWAFYQSYTLGIKRLYIFIFELGLMGYAAVVHRKSPLAWLLALTGLLTLGLGLGLFDPFRRRYFGIVAVFVIALIPFVLSKAKQLQRILLLGLVLLFGLNTVLGDLYLGITQRQNTPYQALTESLQAVIPEDAVIAAPIHLWTALHPYFTVTNIHHLPILGYDTYDHLFASGNFTHVIYAPMMLSEAYSPTEGGTAALSFEGSPYEVFFRNLLSSTSGLIPCHQFPSKPYGDVLVYCLPAAKD